MDIIDARRGIAMSVDGTTCGPIHGQIVTCVLAALSLLLAVGCTAPSRKTADIRSGADLFVMHCAGCHGDDARGNGVVASYLKLPAPDITLIAARRGGRFSRIEVYRIIDGQSSEDFNHRKMPIWGYEFFGGEASDEAAHQVATTSIASLVSYLESIQRVP